MKVKQSGPLSDSLSTPLSQNHAKHLDPRPRKEAFITLLLIRHTVGMMLDHEQGQIRGALNTTEGFRLQGESEVWSRRLTW